MRRAYSADLLRGCADSGALLRLPVTPPYNLACDAYCRIVTCTDDAERAYRSCRRLRARIRGKTNQDQQGCLRVAAVCTLLGTLKFLEMPLMVVSRPRNALLGKGYDSCLDGDERVTRDNADAGSNIIILGQGRIS